jgi:hypothetical protein
VPAFSFRASDALPVKSARVPQCRSGPNSIWFQDADKFAHWQRLKRRGNSTALASYQDKVLSNRDAWQFINQLRVRVLRFEPGKHRVNVEMRTEGRLLGTKWLLDSDSLLQ